MKPLTILLIAAGVVSAASVPIEPRDNALAARQNTGNDDADVETAVERDDVDEDNEVTVEVEDENEDAVAEEGRGGRVDEEVEENENVNDENDSSGGGSSNGDVSSGGGRGNNRTSSDFNNNFNNFNLDDFLNLGVNDVLRIPNLRQREADLASALLGMLNAFGLNSVVSRNDLIGFGFQAELQMFLALQQIGQLLSAGRIGRNDAFRLIQTNILGNGINNFGRNGFNGLNGFNFGGFGNGRAFNGGSRGGFRGRSVGRDVGE